ncbi:phosphoethanolamine transferase [Solimonas marina]|uniref:Phosphoethanolamine--lipid A transferase n=1 Tax=Solimonas marina TaxID=2714601 RepID=A0A969WB79_9GAMM|nr:phosphoethanolamine--lipid A transferase [Solimonas marina]NKF22818.1 phosphoethanolamine--lipid A transferase [Solimonas marina]
MSTLTTTRPGLRQRLPAISANVLIVVVAAFIVLFDNNRFWSIAHGAIDSDLTGVILQVSTALILIGAYSVLFSLLSWRPLLKPVLIFMLIFSAGSAYFIDQLHVIINLDMVRNVADTNTREATELMTPSMALYFLLRAGLPAVLVAIWPLRYSTALRELRTRFIVMSLLLVAALALLASQYKNFSIVGRQNKELGYFINPFYPAKSFYKYAVEMMPHAPLPISPLGRDALRPAPAPGQHPQVVVLMLGETARAANFGLDGYARQTTPELAATPGLINFRDTASCGTATAISVPCMFSLLGKQHWSSEPKAQYLNVIDVLANTGVKVHWRDNDGGCKGVCGSAETVDVTKNGPASLCDDLGCHDDVLVQDLPALLDNVKGDTLIVLHLMGSHGPEYDHRYPPAFRHFTPACRSAQVQDCPRDEIVNAYDNTILYTDHVLGEVLGLLQQRSASLDTAMIYLSDHGESLGENGVYLHGLPYALAPAEQTHVPFVAWLSPTLEQRQKLQPACLQKIGDAPRSHDNLAPMLLGLFGVDSKAYQADLDPLSSCRG